MNEYSCKLRASLKKYEDRVGQWRRQLWGTCPSSSNNCIFSSLWSKSESQLSKYCVVCEISWCRCQQLTARSISTALVTKLLVIEQLLHPALKFAVSAHDLLYMPLLATNPGDATEVGHVGSYQSCTIRRPSSSSSSTNFMAT